jgi:hypothetical protein
MAEHDVAKMSFEELATRMRYPPTTHEHLSAEAEFTIRQIKAQLDATEAQKAAAKAEEKAAEASVESAKAAKLNGWLMLASVIVALVSAIAAACSAYFSYLSTIHPSGS